MTSLCSLYEPVNERLAVNNLERPIVGDRQRLRGADGEKKKRIKALRRVVLGFWSPLTASCLLMYS